MQTFCQETARLSLVETNPRCKRAQDNILRPREKPLETPDHPEPPHITMAY